MYDYDGTQPPLKRCTQIFRFALGVNITESFHCLKGTLRSHADVTNEGAGDRWPRNAEER